MKRKIRRSPKEEIYLFIKKKKRYESFKFSIKICCLNTYAILVNRFYLVLSSVDEFFQGNHINIYTHISITGIVGNKFANTYRGSYTGQTGISRSRCDNFRDELNSKAEVAGMQPSHSPQETNFTYVQRDECALTTIYAWREDVERFLNGAQNSESRKSSVREMILAVEGNVSGQTMARRNSKLILFVRKIKNHRISS